jgi:hypothetical protein
MDNLSYSSEENMSGSSEKCKDGTWHLEMRKEKRTILEKLHFTFGKSKNKKVVQKHATVQFLKFLATKSKKPVKTYQSH